MNLPQIIDGTAHLNDLIPFLHSVGAGNTLSAELCDELKSVIIVKDCPPIRFDMADISVDLLKVLIELCPAITMLEFRFKRLDDITPLTSLTELESLAFIDTAVSDTTPIAKLTELNELSLSGTNIDDISLLSGLSKLNRLGLQNTQVSDFTPIAKLTELNELNLGETKIEDISLLSGLTKLNRLYLWNTKISDFTPIAKLTELNELYLGETKIEDISLLSGLSKLNRLYLWNTKISDIAPIAKLTELNELDLSGTKIEDISLLSGLSKLNRLYLSNTQISDLAPIAKLTDLNELSLRGTKIEDITPLKELNLLHYLSIDNTLVKSIEPLERLSKLEALNISGLALDELPRFCLRDGLRLFINNTVFSKQPAELFSLPNEQVIDLYYDQERIPINEGKVIFLGDSDVGKTHTIKRILAHGKKKKYNTTSTPGVDISSFDCRDGTVINFWDFGGQEILRSMHSCFMTERTCYVIVISNREAGKAMNQAKRWLRTVAGFTNGVSVLLAVNQWHNVAEQRNITEQELKNICPALTDVVYYSAQDDTEERFNRVLTERIKQEVKKLDSVKLELPESWEAVRKEVSKLSKNYITLNQYNKICEKHGLAGESASMEAIRMWLLEWLNDLGHCFSYHKNPPSNTQELLQYKVLRPKWLTNGIYRIVDNGHNCTAGGIVSRDDLYSLLNDSQYVAVDKKQKYDKKGDVTYITEVMRKFERAYMIDEEREFIPETLNDKPPMNREPRGYDVCISYNVKLTYLPITLIHRMMIALYKWTDGVIWRKGFRVVGNDEILLVSVVDESVVQMKLFKKNDKRNSFFTLFHQARSRLLRDCADMKLVIESETIKLEAAGACWENRVQMLLNVWEADKNQVLFDSANGIKSCTVSELLNPVFSNLMLSKAVELKKTFGCELIEALNAICIAYPYANNETMDKLQNEEMLSLRFSEFPTEHLALNTLNFESRLVAAIIADPKMYDWLLSSGCETISTGVDEIMNKLCEERLINGINRNLLQWAVGSRLYKKALADHAEDYETLKKALGPNSRNRYIASFELMKAIWVCHPEIGLHPDYELLSEFEHSGQYYNKYRDHLSHMFKVFLLGLFLYENHAEIRERIKDKHDEEEFLKLWILAALYHDAGYLIETEDGHWDSDEAKRVLERIKALLSLPLTALYPDVFHDGTEKGYQVYNSSMRIPSLITKEVIENKLEEFNGFGSSVNLMVSKDGNPIKTYYERKAMKNSDREYYDHGIVSACLLLFTCDSLCAYVKESADVQMLPEQKVAVERFNNTADSFKKLARLAANAIALHNINKKINSDEACRLNGCGILISEFKIELSKEPLAYLLRLCDELQCWDRDSFTSPIGSDYSVGGDKLEFDIGCSNVRLNVMDAGVKAKLQKALNDPLVPSGAECLEIANN